MSALIFFFLESLDAKPESIKRVEILSNKTVEFVKGDLTDCANLRFIFKKVWKFGIFEIYASCFIISIDILSSVHYFLRSALRGFKICEGIVGYTIVILFEQRDGIY